VTAEQAKRIAKDTAAMLHDRQFKNWTLVSRKKVPSYVEEYEFKGIELYSTVELYRDQVGNDDIVITVTLYLKNRSKLSAESCLLTKAYYDSQTNALRNATYKLLETACNNVF
jgi:hypothetical protein